MGPQAGPLENHCSQPDLLVVVIKTWEAPVLTHTTEKHGEVHDSDGPPPALVVCVLAVVTAHRQHSSRTINAIAALRYNSQYNVHVHKM